MLPRSGRHPSILRQDDTLVVVVDMQEPFLRNIWERDRLVGNVTSLLEAARLLRVPIVPTLQYAEKMGPPIPEVAKRLPSLCVPFEKMSFSCVSDEAFISEVQRSGRKQVVLCGVEAHICIAQTALDLMVQGFQVHIPADAVSSRAQANWQLGLNRVERAGGILTSTEAVAYELLVEAGTSEFRELLPLFK